MGSIATEMKPRRLVAQPVPSFSYTAAASVIVWKLEGTTLTLDGKKWKHGTEHVSQNSIRCDGGCSVQRTVYIDQVEGS